MKTPISLLIDDPAPVISVYYEHTNNQTTTDGRPLISSYSNELLFEFCDIIERHGIRGKFSVVPMPANKGNVVDGIQGVSQEDFDAWLTCVRERVMPFFAIGPEMLTHHKAVDLSTGESLPLSERDWAATQNRETLIPYISKALSLLKEAGLNTIGVTSPWDFGIEVEDEYQYAISVAVEKICQSKKAWFFLRTMKECPNAKPWVAYEAEGRTLVSIPGTIGDYFWRTINSLRTDKEYILEIADKLLTEDGKDGIIARTLDEGSYPILVTHWQSLMSNGLGTGLKILDEVGRRVKSTLSDRVEWMDFEQITDLVLSNKASYPKPEF